MLGSETIVRPDTSISENSLFTGAAHEPSMVLRSDLMSELTDTSHGMKRVEVLSKAIISYNSRQGKEKKINTRRKIVQISYAELIGFGLSEK